MHSDSADKEDNLILFDKSPFFIENGEMRDYQVRGLNWLVTLQHNGINGILADEMGLGKTLQTISLLGYMKHYKNMNGPHLVIVPESTLQNWMNEINKWCPTLRPCAIIGDETERKKVINEVILQQNFDVCCTTYEMAPKVKTQLTKLVWNYIVIDDAHRIKNFQVADVVFGMKSSHKLVLSGLPLQDMYIHALYTCVLLILPKDESLTSTGFKANSRFQVFMDKQRKELQRRCNTLIGLIEKEMGEDEAKPEEGSEKKDATCPDENGYVYI